MRSIFLLLLLALSFAGCGVVGGRFNQEGAQAFDRQDLETARRNFTRAVYFDDGNPAFHNNLGYTLYLLKEFEKSEREFGSALENKPDEKLARQIEINQAMLYSQGQPQTKPEYKDWNEKGIKVLQELLASDPRNAEFHMRLGFIYFRSADPGGGFSELDQAVRFATPKEVARYSADPTRGSLLILQEIQDFYGKIRYFKKVREVQKTIIWLEMNTPKS